MKRILLPLAIIFVLASAAQKVAFFVYDTTDILPIGNPFTIESSTMKLRKQLKLKTIYLPKSRFVMPDTSFIITSDTLYGFK